MELQMVRWAGWLIVFFGAAHTLGALTIEGAAWHMSEWFNGALRHDDLSNMSAANSAFWLSVYSFGIPLILVGLMVLWLQRRGIAPPQFLAWVLGIWTIIGAIVLTFKPWPILLLAVCLLLAGAHRSNKAT
ncbi:DUF6463 family protein [Mycolicibacterium goodii]|uniref:DUF6463 family protein n=1 Tax=Mycolicibacterium goodii TaxID=134601 RepID=UPI00256E9FC2|nr:DUF6463 family protein [Mycolicibacterium goodii]